MVELTEFATIFWGTFSTHSFTFSTKVLKQSRVMNNFDVIFIPTGPYITILYKLGLEEKCNRKP